MKRKYTILNILLTTLWVAIGAGTVVLLVAAIQKKDEQRCSGLYIKIQGVSNNFFVDKKDIQNAVYAISGGNPVGKAVGSFNLKTIELVLQKNVWIKNAQLFFDNNGLLQVNVLEREPVARVFTTTGTTFYLDSSIAMLPLSDKFSARLPVFTSFPSDKKVLLKADSNLLKDIVKISMAIHQDSFLMAMIDQVDITPQRTFEMVPKFGNTIIVFGDAKDADEKFAKLQVFYKDVVVQAGWNKYNAINVQYKGQVVASRKDAREVRADSIRTLQLMKAIVQNAERMSADSLQSIMPDNDHNSTNSNLIQQSIERDDNNTLPHTIEKLQPQEEPGQVAVQPVLIPATTKDLTFKAKPETIIKKTAVTAPAKKDIKIINDKKPGVLKNAKTTVPKTVVPRTLTPKTVMPKQAAKKPANEY